MRNQEGFPGDAGGKEPTYQCRRGKRCNAGSIPGSGISSGGGHGNLLSYFCLEPGGLCPIGWQSWTRLKHACRGILTGLGPDFKADLARLRMI